MRQTGRNRPLPLARLALAGLAAALLFGLAPIGAGAEEPRLWKTCETGSGAGQCWIPRGVAAQPSPPGHLFVGDQANDRVVELAAWGDFVRAWGWGVVDGSPELQVCTEETGCVEGLRGDGTGQLAAPQGMAVDSAGSVYVVDTDNGRVQKFSPEGEFVLMFGGKVNRTKEEEAAPEAQQNLCTAASGDTCQAGVEGVGQGQFSSWPFSSYIAVDTGGTGEAGDDIVYVGDTARIQKFDVDGSYLGEVELPEAGTVGSLAVDSRAGQGDIYFSYPPINRKDGKAEKPYVYRLDAETGEVQYKVEVGLPAALATDLEGNLYVFDQQANSNEAGGNHITRLLEFDEEGDFVTVVAQNASTLIGDVFPVNLFGFPVSTGIATGSACLSGGAAVYVASLVNSDSFIRAFGPPPDDPPCPPVRRAPSIEEQRAVSVGTEEASLEAQINPHFWSSTEGTTTYFVQYATAECISSQYIARREPSGWHSENISPPKEGGELLGYIYLDVLFRAFSHDLEQGWLMTTTEPVLGEGGQPGYVNIYRRENATGGYEGCTSEAPAGTSPRVYLPHLQGISADGRLAIFRANGKLTDDATAKTVTGEDGPEGIHQLYICEATEGAPPELSLVSVRTTGFANEVDSTVGSQIEVDARDRESILIGALSDDGSRVYWSAEGILYLRTNPTEDQSARQFRECTEPEKACTVEVASGSFRTATPDGARVLYDAGGTLYEYDAEAQISTPIAAGVKGLAGASEDLTRTYLASAEVLSAEPNSEGDLPVEGGQNLYLHEGGGFTFVATLAADERERIGLGALNAKPNYHLARVGSDGLHLAFVTKAALTGFDKHRPAHGTARGGGLPL